MITSIELKTFTKEEGYFFDSGRAKPHPHLTAFQLIVKSDKSRSGVIFDVMFFETSDASKLLAAFDRMKKAVEDELNSGRL